MKFTYDGTEYTMVDPEDWTTLEAIRLEAESGRKPAELVVSFQDAQPLGVHALAWVTVRRAGVDVVWNELTLPWFGTVQSLNSGTPVVAPEDPSTASTPARKPARAGRGSPARSAKK